MLLEKEGEEDREEKVSGLTETRPRKEISTETLKKRIKSILMKDEDDGVRVHVRVCACYDEMMGLVK